jgi:hypothetical protein
MRPRLRGIAAQSWFGCMSKFWIPEHIHYCAADGAIYCLDERTDRYISVDASKAQGMGDLVHGWPTESESGMLTGLPSADPEAVAEMLASEGLLTRDPRLAHTCRSAEAVMPQRALLAKAEGGSTCIRWSHCIRFIAACIATFVTLKCFSLSFALDRLRATKARAQARAVDAPNMAHARELVSVFLRLRVLVYSFNNACLFDSITLARFLIAYDVCPIFVMGIMPRPFRAHAWVQYDDVAFNTEPGLGYRPILTI